MSLGELGAPAKLPPPLHPSTRPRSNTWKRFQDLSWYAQVSACNWVGARVGAKVACADKPLLAQPNHLHHSYMWLLPNHHPSPYMHSQLDRAVQPVDFALLTWVNCYALALIVANIHICIMRTWPAQYLLIAVHTVCMIHRVCVVHTVLSLLCSDIQCMRGLIPVVVILPSCHPHRPGHLRSSLHLFITELWLFITFIFFLDLLHN